MKMIYKLKTFRLELKVSESNPREKVDPIRAASILRQIFRKLDQDQEHFVILALDRKNQVRGYKTVASGGMHESHVDLRILFRCALLLGASKLILAHNHPSADPWPSAEDELLTHRLETFGAALQIEIMDHIILGGGKFFSFSLERRLKGAVPIDLLLGTWEVAGLGGRLREIKRAAGPDRARLIEKWKKNLRESLGFVLDRQDDPVRLAAIAQGLREEKNRVMWRRRGSPTQKSRPARREEKISTSPEISTPPAA